MSIPLRWLVAAGVLVLPLAAPPASFAQDELAYTLKYNSGQTVQPIFEGWSRNPDGSFAMHFGYLNRNFAEQLHIPIGPDNRIEPGGPDQGQPTFFYTRINRNLFTVTVPKDWGRKELVWTVTVRGKTERATGWLQPEWEIDPLGGAGGGGGRFNEARAKNQPPTIAVEAVQPVRLPDTMTLVAMSTDDGLPKPGTSRRNSNGRATPPTLQGSLVAPVNVPDLSGDARGGDRQSGPQGLSVSWMVWRGPASVTFEPQVATVQNGTAVVTATFTKPGAYVLRARATDTMFSAIEDVHVTADPAPAAGLP